MAVKIFKAGYPYVNALYQLSILAHYIGYLYNKTPFFSPWLRLIGIEIKRMSAADYVRPCREMTVSRRSGIESAVDQVNQTNPPTTLSSVLSILSLSSKSARSNKRPRMYPREPPTP